MSEGMKLSIIVPVYNVEQHLERCLESIAVEMCDDYELLLIDDGSTDRSGALCDAFAECHPQLHVVVMHQPNEGLSAARNRGIEASRGTYITFIDSDDHIDPLTLSRNVDYLLSHPEVDMLEYPIEVHAESAEAYMLTFPDATQRDDIFADWVRREGYGHCYACNKIFRSALWSDVSFPRDTYFEDTVVMPLIVKRCRAIHYSATGCYRYVMHSGSITTSYSYVKQRQLFESNYRLYLEIRSVGALRSEALRLWLCCLNQLVDLGRCVDVDTLQYEATLREVARHRPSYGELLCAASRAVTRLKLLPLPLLGLRTYCRLYVALTKPLHG